MKDTHLLFSDNIVKVNPVPLPPAIDISLKDKSEDNNTIIYGSIKTSSNWISITDTKTDEFNALKQYLNPPSYTATFPITGEQLREIFCTNIDKCKSPSLEECENVANLINKYSDLFEINTALRMAHFLGQVGWESNNLKAMGKKSGEGTCYNQKSTGWEKIWFKSTWKELPFNYTGCPEAPPNNKKPRKNKNHWTDISEVPKKYICDGGEVVADTAGKNLFSYVYRCEGGNGDEASGDGFRYRGHGIMQLTWKKQYVAFEAWLQLKGFPKDFNKILTNPDEGFKNLELDILSGMWYWDRGNCNGTADKIQSGSTRDEFDKITKKINDGLLDSDKRKEIFEKSYSILKK